VPSEKYNLTNGAFSVPEHQCPFAFAIRDHGREIVVIVAIATFGPNVRGSRSTPERPAPALA